ncbi:MAG: HAD-IIIC family phosphatase [Candidatus Diapherotrites archaeon]
MKKSPAAAKAEKITAIFTDLDNTLWSGIIAEGQEPVLREDYYAFLKGLYAKGIQIFAVSKNEEADLEKAFRKLGVDKEMFTMVVANWDAKYLNIERLIRQANIRRETAVFIDDSPFERAEAEKALPEIHVLDENGWRAVLANEYVRGKKEQPASEIRERINRYRTAIAAHRGEHAEKESIEFLRSLGRELSIGEIPADNLDRFARLLVDTHRINFNPGKFGDYGKALDYLHQRINAGDRLYAVSTRESGVSLGLTGALVVDVKGNTASIVDGTFSCGILGRGFEGKSILALADILRKQGLERLDIFVTLTATNSRVKEILLALGFSEGRRISGKAGTKVVYSADLRAFRPRNDFGWIKVIAGPPEIKYTGHPFVISFFEENVLPLIGQGFGIVNLGSARGESIGHAEEKKRDEFYKLLHQRDVKYTKIDVEHYPEENNIVADAEDLPAVLQDESQDLVLAFELLEHARHFWNVVTEMVRICRTGGYILVSVPSFNYPKHEYPIDLWRIGPKTLKSFFPAEYFETIKFATEGQKNAPRRAIILVRKKKQFTKKFSMPNGGKTDWKTGLTVFL